MDRIDINLSKDELVLFNNAVNEVLNGPDAIDDKEFQTRLGVNRPFAKDTLARISDLLEK